MYSDSHDDSPPVENLNAWFSSSIDNGGSFSESWSCSMWISSGDAFGHGDGLAPSSGSKSVRSDREANWTMLVMNQAVETWKEGREGSR